MFTKPFCALVFLITLIPLTIHSQDLIKNYLIKVQDLVDIINAQKAALGLVNASDAAPPGGSIEQLNATVAQLRSDKERMDQTIQTLVSTTEDLLSQNHQLNQTIESLSSENAQLRADLQASVGSLNASIQGIGGPAPGQIVGSGEY